MSRIKNSTVLITGGAGGLGKLMALACGKEGAHSIILWDINDQLLSETQKELSGKGYSVFTYKVDVSKTEEIYENAQKVLDQHGSVDILFNNAGIVVGKTFVEHTPNDIDMTMRINVNGMMHVAKAFLPAMIEQEKGHIVNIASASGLIPNPRMSVYAASKWAVVGWSESLRLELEEGFKDIHVTTVEPSYINTGMFDGVKGPLLTPIMEPAYIVEKIISGVKSNAIILREPFMVKSVPVLRGVLPTRLFDFMARTMGVYNSMDNFKGKAH